MHDRVVSNGESQGRSRFNIERLSGWSPLFFETEHIAAVDVVDALVCPFVGCATDVLPFCTGDAVVDEAGEYVWFYEVLLGLV